MKTLNVLVLAAALGLAAGDADAATVHFAFDRANSSVMNSVSNLNTTISSSSASAHLSTGRSFTFNAIRFSSPFPSTGLGSGSITANLAFNPPGLFVTAPGTATVLTVLGSFLAGSANFEVVNFGDAHGSQFRLALSSVNFGDCGGPGQPVCISRATVTAVNVVPLPAAGWLLLGGLAGLGLLGRHRRAAAA